jgi:dihydroorotase/N-acyl-D-amino-acid deacylase
VAPGFIDMLGHSEYRLLRDGRAISKISQGITSEVTGEVTSVVPVNDSTLASLEPDTRELVGWTDLPGYFAQLESGGTAINVGAPRGARRGEPRAVGGGAGADAGAGRRGDAGGSDGLVGGAHLRARVLCEHG